MCGLSAIREEVIEALRGDKRFAGIKIGAEYAGEQRKLPVRETEVIVGIERVEIQDSAFGDREADFPACAPLAGITLRFDCYIPRSEELSMYFAGELFDCLLMKAGAVKLWSGAAEPEIAAMANRLRIFAEFRALLEPEEPEEEKRMIGEVILRAVNN